jgi:hypothetical protein
MATRTAPDMTTAANRRIVTFRFIDSSGDLFSQSFDVALAATAANLEALADAFQAATQASLFSIQDTVERNGQASVANADTGSRDSVKNGINTLLKIPTTGESFAPRLIAPQPVVMVGTTDTPNVLADEFVDWVDALELLFPAYDFVSAQFTERRERRNNEKVKG